MKIFLCGHKSRKKKREFLSIYYRFLKKKVTAQSISQIAFSFIKVNSSKEDGVMFIIPDFDCLCNSGRFSLVFYTKDFGRITHFWGNDLATVPISALCCELLSLLLVLTQRYEDFSIHTQSSKKKEWEKCYLQINIRYLFLYLNLFARILLYSSIID